MLNEDKRRKKSDYIELMQLFNDFVKSDRYSNLDNDSFYKVLENNNSHIIVAEVDGKLVGFATVSIREVVRYPKPIAELDELFVSPDYREQETGRILMKRIEELAKRYTCYRMFIQSHYDYKAAHKFYEALGYTNYGYHFIRNL